MALRRRIGCQIRGPKHHAWFQPSSSDAKEGFVNSRACRGMLCQIRKLAILVGGKPKVNTVYSFFAIFCRKRQRRRQIVRQPSVLVGLQIDDETILGTRVKFDVVAYGPYDHLATVGSLACVGLRENSEMPLV